MDAKRRSPYARIKGMVKSCFILTFLLGITWIFGFIQIWSHNHGNEIFGFIFIILNCSTGIFIFLYTIIFDAKMVEASKKTIQRSSRRLTNTTRLSFSHSLSKKSRSLKDSFKRAITSSNKNIINAERNSATSTNLPG